MELKQLRTFVAVVEQGSVSKAAQHLHTAQPALSRQIADLEAELGLTLFDRVGRRLLLTGEGERLLGNCRSLLGQARSLGEQAQALRGGDSGLLKVAAAPVQIESALATFLPEYCRRYPNVEVKVIESIGANTIGLLQRGEVHLGITILDVVRPHGKYLQTRPLPPHELLAACNPAFRLSKGATADIEDVVSHPLLLLDAAFAVRKKFDSICRAGKLKLDIFIECRTPHTLLALAEAGLGIAIIPSAAGISRYGVRTARIAYKGKAVLDPLAIVWERRRVLPRYATAFCELVAAHVRGTKHAPRSVGFAPTRGI
jgi:DNA-binding transcriptional LysR family regulator